MPDMPSRRPVPGRAIVARRALAEIARAAVLGSYGVTGLAEPSLIWRLRSRLRLGSGAIHVELRPAVQVDVWVRVAYGLPVAEVARQVDSAVRYGLSRALGHEVGPIAIHVQGLGHPYTSGPAAPTAAAPTAAAPTAAVPVEVPVEVPVAADVELPVTPARRSRTGGGAA